MKPLRALALALVASQACAQEPATPADVTAWLGTASPDAVHAAAEGDLTGHGTKDWAGVVHRTLSAAELQAQAEADPDAREDTMGGWQVVVFLQQPDGHHRLAVQSPPFSWNCGTSRCWMDDMHIARQSLFVQRKWTWHGCYDEVNFQFKARDGGWPLIGIRSESSSTPYPDDDGTKPSKMQNIDWNRLTGDVIVSSSQDWKHKHVKRLKISKPTLDLADFEDYSVPVEDSLPSICTG